MGKPVICVVGTGGTIASRFDARLGGHVSTALAQDLVAAVPELVNIADVRVVEHSNINSALMDTATAFGLRDTLRQVLQDDAVAGAVVTHGTATLEETAYLMDLTVGGDKPVVFTGAQRNADEKDPDGPRNLLYAAMIAAHPEAKGRGVLVALGSEIHAALDVTKINPEIITCFGARDCGAVGSVTKSGVTFFPCRSGACIWKSIRSGKTCTSSGWGRVATICCSVPVSASAWTASWSRPRAGAM